MTQALTPSVTTQAVSAANASAAPAILPAVISAPFGNYVQPAGATATLGTFTAAARPGRVWRIVKTVRYSPTFKAWVNKIGLRNPGMPWLVARVGAGKIDVRDKLVSIHGFTPDDWRVLLEQAAQIRPLAVELNMSCPNVGHINWPETLFADALATGVPVVVKLPPVRYEEMASQAFKAGVRVFHCTNTLPIERGGLSGAPLKPIALEVVRAMRREYADAIGIIGGGGVRTPQDVDEFVAAGANHVALGTITMNPILLLTHRPIAPLIRRAHEQLGRR